MADWLWLKLVIADQFGFVEWTPEGHLRHSRFTGCENIRMAQEVIQEIEPRIPNAPFGSGVAAARSLGPGRKCSWVT